MMAPEILKQWRALRALGWGSKRLARELGIAHDSVRRYLRDETAETQTRPERPGRSMLASKPRRVRYSAERQPGMRSSCVAS